MSLRLLVVEDDRDLRELMRGSLSVEGFEVQTAVSLSEAAALIRHSPPDVIVLDLGLPDGDGAELVQEVRRRHSLPILVVSARHQESQKIKLLDAGADDYLTKPFSVSELLARIRVALRHRGTTLAAAVTVHELDGLRVDLSQHSVQLHGETLHLTPTEFKLLARLVRSAGRVVTHRQLLADVWGPEYTEHVHYLRLYMAQLRAKIEQEPAEPRHLLTETGVGYRLAVD
jgi:two-component system, OmpR family, KDP operon response regulator KdpE